MPQKKKLHNILKTFNSRSIYDYQRIDPNKCRQADNPASKECNSDHFFVVLTIDIFLEWSLIRRSYCFSATVRQHQISQIDSGSASSVYHGLQRPRNAVSHPT